ncbi:lytic transglycosylase [Zhengella mangrovi]|uniref:Lytic transglycosylase n=1 Tax=Zhengella mangrovi TaxID=1982044 RepID=A0A2G1QQ57_9HYPH|nr:transglycosylase SLT domain-containing protein [Zhengella mangrovi]PHP67601.1 lytic transglycosylase [Zhengella mangrovi]
MKIFNYRAMAIAVAAGVSFSAAQAYAEPGSVSSIERGYVVVNQSGEHHSEELNHNVSAGYALPVAGRKYSALIEHYAAEYGVPPKLAHAIVRIESNYRANARGSAGEIGLMQVKPSTARLMGYHGSARGLFHPETNIKFGMKYLGKAHKLGGGTICGTILKYNAGHAAKRMNPVSRRYCAKVKRYM